MDILEPIVANAKCLLLHGKRPWLENTLENCIIHNGATANQSSNKPMVIYCELFGKNINFFFQSAKTYPQIKT